MSAKKCLQEMSLSPNAPSKLAANKIAQRK